ncbi:hypothetical protein JAAARDRAFT_51488 [Jaapia argillacea MUCL 33604]|uniref:Uncharacterized protein n=1 Tax=Jaapia argillacea MUCL 33604 TaxID=933084 RepID=A0A067PHT1_9AGAM|nr:hypothetical protein JAAARDRAFT_51488 [Jaapia argillacea MUCL 33604]
MYKAYSDQLLNVVGHQSVVGEASRGVANTKPEYHLYDTFEPREPFNEAHQFKTKALEFGDTEHHLLVPGWDVLQAEACMLHAHHELTEKWMQCMCLVGIAVLNNSLGEHGFDTSKALVAVGRESTKTSDKAAGNWIAGDHHEVWIDVVIGLRPLGEVVITKSGVCAKVNSLSSKRRGPEHIGIGCSYRIWTKLSSYTSVERGWASWMMAFNMPRHIAKGNIGLSGRKVNTQKYHCSRRKVKTAGTTPTQYDAKSNTEQAPMKKPTTRNKKDKQGAQVDAKSTLGSNTSVDTKSKPSTQRCPGTTQSQIPGPATNEKRKADE